MSASGAKTVISGTAFYVRKDSDMYIVTNRHNVDAAMKDKKYAGYKPDHITLSGYFDREHLNAELVEQEVAIAFPNNADEDVAVIGATTLKFAVNKPNEMITNYFDFSALATDDDLSKIDVCDMLAIPGYPDYYDRNGDRPIVRMGTVASDPESNYCDDGMSPARRIAYEAFSSAGSSGSPVFSLAKGWKAGMGLTGGYFRDSKLIGINAGHLQSRETYLGHSGISYCFKSTCIIDTIKKFDEERQA